MVQIVSSSSESPLVKVWDIVGLQSTAIFAPVEDANSVPQAVWGQNGKALVCISNGADSRVNVCSTDGSTVVTLQPLEKHKLLCLAVGQSTASVVTGSEDGAVALWDVRKRALAKQLKPQSCAVSSVDLDSSSSYLATGNDAGDVCVYNLTTGRASKALRLDDSQAVHCLQYSPSRQSRLVSAGDEGAVNMWDVNAYKLWHTFGKVHSAPATAVAHSPVNKHFILTSGLDKRVAWLDPNERRVIRYMTADSPVTALSFADSGHTVLLGLSTGTIVLYDLRNQSAPLSTVEAHAPHSVTSLDVVGRRQWASPVPPQLASQSEKGNDDKPYGRFSLATPEKGLAGSAMPLAAGTVPRPPLTLLADSALARVMSPPRVSLYGRQSLSSSNLDTQSKPIRGVSGGDLLGGQSTTTGLARESTSGLLSLANALISPAKSMSGRAQAGIGDKQRPLGVQVTQSSRLLPTNPIVPSKSANLFPSTPRKQSAPLLGTMQPIIREPNNQGHGYGDGAGVSSNTESVQPPIAQPMEMDPAATPLDPKKRPPLDSNTRVSNPVHSSAEDGGERLVGQLVQSAIDQSVERMGQQLHGEIQALHLDMLRQMHELKEDIETMVKKYSLNDTLLAEVVRLREENKRLRCRY